MLLMELKTTKEEQEQFFVIHMNQDYLRLFHMPAYSYLTVNRTGESHKQSPLDYFSLVLFVFVQLSEFIVCVLWTSAFAPTVHCAKKTQNKTKIVQWRLLHTIGLLTIQIDKYKSIFLQVRVNHNLANPYFRNQFQRLPINQFYQ